jgi:ADP-ribose pyrophosphatase
MTIDERLTALSLLQLSASRDRRRTSGYNGFGMKPLRREIAFSTPFFEVVAKTMSEGELPFYSLRLPDYASTVAMVDGCILLVEQYRPAVEKVTLELPSGLVDPGETPAEAAKRELLEETGYVAAEIEVLGALLPDTGRLGNRTWCCVARGLRRAEQWTPEAGLTVSLATPSELDRAMLDGRFDHALHVAALAMARLKSRRE